MNLWKSHKTNNSNTILRRNELLEEGDSSAQYLWTIAVVPYQYFDINALYDREMSSNREWEMMHLSPSNPV